MQACSCEGDAGECSRGECRCAAVEGVQMGMQGCSSVECRQVCSCVGLQAGMQACSLGSSGAAVGWVQTGMQACSSVCGVQAGVQVCDCVCVWSCVYVGMVCVVYI